MQQTAYPVGNKEANIVAGIGVARTWISYPDDDIIDSRNIAPRGRPHAA